MKKFAWPKPSIGKLSEQTLKIKLTLVNRYTINIKYKLIFQEQWVATMNDTLRLFYRAGSNKLANLLMQILSKNACKHIFSCLFYLSTYFFLFISFNISDIFVIWRLFRTTHTTVERFTILKTLTNTHF